MENIGIGSDEIRTTNIYPFQSVFDFFNDLEEIKSSSGFMELLGAQSFINPSLLSDTASLQQTETTPPVCMENITAIDKVKLLSSDVLNQPETPNSSSISSADDVNDEQEEDKQQKVSTTNKQLKSKKPKKTQREPRVAFMTKSEVDHLEDGYRWRKYGQKAVKNSPFPRGYYRCTTASCNVKKRVERSFTDPSIVVTTYEGQHTHPSPFLARPSFCRRAGSFLGSSNSTSGFGLQMQQTSSRFSQPLLFHQQQTSLENPLVPIRSYGNDRPCSTVGSGLNKDNGLLQDVVPSHMFLKLPSHVLKEEQS